MIAAVLEVLAFAQDVGGDQDTRLLARGVTSLLACWLLSGLNRQARSVGSSESPVTPATCVRPRAPKLRVEVAHRVGELSEDDDLFVAVLLGQQIPQARRASRPCSAFHSPQRLSGP